MGKSWYHMKFFLIFMKKEYLELLVRKFKQTHRNFIRLTSPCLVERGIFGDNLWITAQREACKIQDPWYLYEAEDKEYSLGDGNVSKEICHYWCDNKQKYK